MTQPVPTPTAAVDHAALLAAITGAPELSAETPLVHPSTPTPADPAPALGDSPAASQPPRGNSPINPDHYSRFKIQPIQFARENGLQFWQANVVKYILRSDAKNGIEDIEKAIDFLMKERAYLQGDPNWFTVKWDHS